MMTIGKAQALDEKTLLLAIDFGRFGNTRMLSDDQYEVQAKKDYTAAAKKRLQSKPLEAIRNHDNATRRWVEAKTLPSMLKPGIYRLPKAMLHEVVNYLITRKAEREQLVDVFRAAYNTDVAQARKDLGPLYNPADYPSEDQAIAEFKMSWRFLASGVPENLQDVDPAVHAEELVKYHENLTYATQAYTSLLRVAMADLVDHLVEMLQPTVDGRKKRVYASGFGNLGSFLKDFPARNVAEDKELAKLATQAEKLLTGVAVEDVRDDEKTRAYVREQFTQVKAAVDNLITEEDRQIGKRKIKLVDAA